MNKGEEKRERRCSTLLINYTTRFAFANDAERTTLGRENNTTHRANFVA